MRHMYTLSLARMCGTPAPEPTDPELRTDAERDESDACSISEFIEHEQLCLRCMLAAIEVLTCEVRARLFHGKILEQPE